MATIEPLTDDDIEAKELQGPTWIQRCHDEYRNAR
jgi:hypothetical protein